MAPYEDKQAIEELAKRADVLTYEFENVDLAALEAVADQVAIPQGTELLRITRTDPEKTFLQEAGLSTAPFAAVLLQAELEAAVIKIGYPSVLKTCEGATMATVKSS